MESTCGPKSDIFEVIFSLKSQCIMECFFKKAIVSEYF